MSHDEVTVTITYVIKQVTAVTHFVMLCNYYNNYI